MPKKLVSAQRQFTMLIANLQAGADPAVANPVTMRATYTNQHFVEIGGRGPDQAVTSNSTPGTGTRQGTMTWAGAPTLPAASAATVTVAAAVTADPASWLRIGEFVITSGEDFVVVNTDTATTATNLAAAIALLDGYGAFAVAAAVTIAGPIGLQGNDIVFEAGGYNPAMFTLAPLDGSLGAAEPHIGPAVIA